MESSIRNMSKEFPDDDQCNQSESGGREGVGRVCVCALLAVPRRVRFGCVLTFFVSPCVNPKARGGFYRVTSHQPPCFDSTLVYWRMKACSIKITKKAPGWTESEVYICFKNYFNDKVGTFEWKMCLPQKLFTKLTKKFPEKPKSHL